MNTLKESTDACPCAGPLRRCLHYSRQLFMVQADLSAGQASLTRPVGSRISLRSHFAKCRKALHRLDPLKFSEIDLCYVTLLDQQVREACSIFHNQKALLGFLAGPTRPQPSWTALFPRPAILCQSQRVMWWS